MTGLALTNSEFNAFRHRFIKIRFLFALKFPDGSTLIFDELMKNTRKAIVYNDSQFIKFSSVHHLQALVFFKIRQ